MAEARRRDELEPPLPGPALAVCGFSGSGKTTLLERVVPELVRRGLAVAAMKHDTRGLTVDHEGKDSDRLFRAGADVWLEGPGEILRRVHAERPPALAGRLAELLRDHDLVLVEGHKRTPLPKVWLDGGAGDAVEHLDEVVLRLRPDRDRPAALLAFLDGWLAEAWARRPVIGGLVAGGRSRRMGQSKAHLLCDDQSYLQRVADAIDPFVDALVLLGEGDHPPLEQEPVPVVPDPPRLDGPLAGLIAALRWAPGSAVVASACDLPLLREDAIRWLVAQRRPGVWAVIPRLASGTLEPLCAVYEPQAAPLLEDLAGAGERAPRRIAEHPKVATPTPPAELAACWRNVNSPADRDGLGPE